jgi:transposase
MKTNSANRASVVAFKASGLTTTQVQDLTGIPSRTINDIYARAIKRGFDPAIRPIRIADSFVNDAARSGRPTKQTEDVKKQILEKVRRDRYGREKTCADIAGELSSEGINLSQTLVWRVLRRAGLRKTKPTRKPGLTPKMRKERLEWCLSHRHWTLEDWKNVIWTDETSVILLHRRGSYRVWRTKDEAFLRSCIRERWKGASEFMFWGSFSYDKKGPCHCWLPETAIESKAAEIAIEALNKELEPLLKEQWELSNGMRRLELRNLPGRKPQWRFNEKNGKLSRSKNRKGGIDWYAYQTKVLIPLLLPFAQECAVDRPGTIVQEDKAPSHSHHAQKAVFDLWKVQRLVWCPNSPDLNAIEAAWPWLKRHTTKKGAPGSRQAAIAIWKSYWQQLPQSDIQKWIERIPRHIEEVIRLEGSNEYREGRGTRT